MQFFIEISYLLHLFSSITNGTLMVNFGQKLRFFLLVFAQKNLRIKCGDFFIYRV